MMEIDDSWWHPRFLEWTFSLRKAVNILKGTASDRKLRLLGLAFCRNLGDKLSDERMIQAVVVAERLVTGPVDDDEIIASRRILETAIGEDRRGRHTTTDEQLVYCKQAVYGLLQEPMSHGIESTLDAAIRLLPSNNDRCRIHVEVLLDIFGHPHRPVAFSPEWRTSTAFAIAQSMHEARDFAPMPLLADALQDAGCEVPEIIDHCRGPGPHVRGCWVVDGVLGKT